MNYLYLAEQKRLEDTGKMVQTFEDSVPGLPIKRRYSDCPPSKPMKCLPKRNRKPMQTKGLAGEAIQMSTNKRMDRGGHITEYYSAVKKSKLLLYIWNLV